MSIWGVAMVKDEIDILPFNVAWMLENVDYLLIADNLSTDGTYEYLLEMQSLHSNIHVVKDQEVAYHQSAKMNQLFKLAFSLDSAIEWIVPFDADEFWIGNNSRHFGEEIKNTQEDIIYASVWHMVSMQVETSESPLHDICWRQENREQFPVVAFRWNTDASIQMGNHDVLWPGGRCLHGKFGVRHYQYRSLAQFKQKVRNGKAAYDATTFDIGVGYHWRMYGAMSDEELTEIWNTWSSERGLIFDPW